MPSEPPISTVSLTALDGELLIESGPTGGAFARMSWAPAESAVSLAHFALAHEGPGPRARMDVDAPRPASLEWYATDRPTESGIVIRQRDAELGLDLATRLDLEGGALVTTTTLTNGGSAPVRVDALSSVALGGLLHIRSPGAALLRSTNAWLAEHRWHSEPLAIALPHINTEIHRQVTRAFVEDSGSGIWTTERSYPGAFATEGPGRRAIGWEVLPDAGWSWQFGERHGWGWLSLAGADDPHHAAPVDLAPGEGMTSARAVVAAGAHGWEEAVDALTAAHRARRIPLASDGPRVIYNDYLNTLGADPEEAAVLSLARSAADVGVELYCTDAGWYDEARDGWWDSIGQWTEAPSRFPSGLRGVRDAVAELGLGFGLWIEPESIGVRSPLAASLPESAFVHRGGRRYATNGRLVLDARDPAAREHMTSSIDRLVSEYGAQFVKLDCNVTPGTGIDDPVRSAGSALEQSARAYREWLATTVAEHPAVEFENCASGGMRADRGLLAMTGLQSTSDQQDFALYAPIAVNAPITIPVEQAGNWASVLPSMTPEETAFTMITGLAGRLYLSGLLDRLDATATELVREGVAFFVANRAHLASTRPRWPLGPAGWDDPWLALLHLHEDGGALLFVWSRSAEPSSVTIGLDGFDLTSAEQVYPRALPDWPSEIDDDRLTLRSGAGLQARIIRLAPQASATVD